MTRAKQHGWLGSAFGGALLAAAFGCGGSDAPGSDGLAGNPGTGAASGLAGGNAAGSHSGTGGGEPGGAGSAGTGGAPAASAGGSGSGGSANTSTPPSRLARYHHADVDPSLSFELDVVAGFEPYPSSLEYLAGFVSRVLDKPAGIFFEVDETLPPFGDDHVWAFTELDAYAREHARDDSDGPVSIHVLLLDGRYDAGEESGTVLGLAWGQRYLALFQQDLRSQCTGGLLGGLSAQACEVAERNVWAHEIGHLIGLVDNGLTQQTSHRDPEHGRHDVSDGCLMYWAYERPAIFDALIPRLNTGQSADLDFCPNCWADLNAARE